MPQRMHGDWVRLDIINPPAPGARSPTVRMHELHNLMMDSSDADLVMWEKVLARIQELGAEDAAVRLNA